MGICPVYVYSSVEILSRSMTWGFHLIFHDFSGKFLEKYVRMRVLRRIRLIWIWIRVEEMKCKNFATVCQTCSGKNVNGMWYYFTGLTLFIHQFLDPGWRAIQYVIVLWSALVDILITTLFNIFGWTPRVEGWSVLGKRSHVESMEERRERMCWAWNGISYLKDVQDSGGFWGVCLIIFLWSSDGTISQIRIEIVLFITW